MRPMPRGLFCFAIAIGLVYIPVTLAGYIVRNWLLSDPYAMRSVDVPFMMVILIILSPILLPDKGCSVKGTHSVMENVVSLQSA